MKKLFLILLFVLIHSFESFSQVYPGARQIALSHSDISFSEDPFSLFNNPSGLSNIKSRTIGLFYSPAPFGESALSTGSGAYIEPVSFGTLSGGFMIYGFDLYKETRIALSFSRKIVDRFSLGVTSIYQNISIQNYGSKGFLSFNIGGVAEITKSLRLGFLLENVSRTKVAGEENSIPVVFSGGIGYKAVEELSVYLAIRKELNYNASLRIGAEYMLMKFLQLRLGASNEPDSFSGGFNISYDIFQFEYAVNSHPDLELSHQFGIVIQLSK
ncbi:MAG: hypothetical protein KGZ42_06195 [Melioribacter sp.]|nr:hypothetical protein [Melioribacter sp.]